MKKNLIFAALFFALSGASSCKDPEKECIDQSKIDPERICTMEYKPVCSCDGKTYGNACEAERAGVTSYETGVCPENDQETTHN